MLQAAKKCPEFTSVWLIIINLFYFIFGIVLIAASAWGIQAAEGDPILQALPSGGLVTLVVVGVFLMVISIVGFLGLRFNSKLGGRYVLGIYATLLIIIMIMEFAAAGVLLTFTGALDKFSSATQSVNYGVFMLVNQSFNECCCGLIPCPNGTCWIPGFVPYPCNSLQSFSDFLADYINKNIEPVGAVAIFLGLMQLMTAIVACVSQCKGRKYEEAHKIGGPMSFDGQYNEGEESYGGYGYESYVKTGQPGARAAAPGGKPAVAKPPGSAPATGGASAPRAGGGRVAAGARAPVKK